jgi:Fur family ferric uptake transcriptional regulator
LHHHGLIETLRERGYRLTPQREMILDVICAEDGHKTAEEIYQRVLARSPAVNLATVYRTLVLLRELGLVTAANLGGPAEFELAHDRSHHHLVCQDCGASLSFDDHLLASLQMALERLYGFEADIEHLVIFGRCSECASASRQPSDRHN